MKKKYMCETCNTKTTYDLIEMEEYIDEKKNDWTYRKLHAYCTSCGNEMIFGDLIEENSDRRINVCIRHNIFAGVAE